MSPKTHMPSEKRGWGLLRRRTCLAPTWRGWLLIIVILLLVTVSLGRHLCSFLSLTRPAPGGVLVVEGWLPDDGMRLVVAEFQTNHYDQLVVIGGPLEIGAPLSEYRTFAEMGAAVLARMGLDSNAVHAVPAERVRQDRTYTAALALKNWLRAQGVALRRVNLISSGPHARRSRLMVQYALGDSVDVGVVSIPSSEYDPDHWWRSSAGVRNVLDEAFAYAYARLFFHPR
jgi:uncharacterized SAM-binding protein YcdF (DUF218 family)